MSRRIRTIKARSATKTKHDVWGSYVVLIDRPLQVVARIKQLIRDAEKVSEKEVEDIEEVRD